MDRKESFASNLESFKDWMRYHALDAYFMLDSDDYLNSKLPIEKNLRFLLTGFKGSRGECVIFLSKKSCLFVDGRYTLQVKDDIDESKFEIINIPSNQRSLDIIKNYFIDLVKQTAQKLTIGFNSYQLSCANYDFLFKSLVEEKGSAFCLKALKYTEIFQKGKKGKKELIQNSVKSLFNIVPNNISGLTTTSKIERIRKILDQTKADFIWITRLDDLSYLCNVRYYGYPYLSVFNGFALIGRKGNYLFLESQLYRQLDDQMIRTYFPLFQVFSDYSWIKIYQDQILKKVKRDTYEVIYDYYSMPLGRLNELKKITNIHLKKDVYQYLQRLRSIKTFEEIEHIKEAYRKTDLVFNGIIKWIKSQGDPEKISEKDIELKLASLFEKQSAKGFSFSIGVASGKNSAYIHYSESKANVFIKRGEVLLIDAGAYFEGGYATDLTRTFWIPNRSLEVHPLYKKIYTLVLRACIRVMKLSFKEGTKAYILDQIARESLKEEGYDFNHGLGHGLGIFVHEYPPTISSSSMDLLKESMIFTIEPGIYIEGFGGIRIENGVVLVKDSTKKGYLKIEPLSFAKLDSHLIDRSFLNQEERAWLEDYESKSSFHDEI